MIAPPSTDVVVRAFEPPPNMRARESLRAASFEAETWATWDQDDRTTSIQTPRISGEALLVGIARATSVERLVTVARCARLRPIAVDAPLCAWQRIAPTADAVLDLWRERAVLVVFGEPVGRVECFAARLSNDRLVAQSNGILASARGDGLRDTRRIEIYGPAERAADIASMFEREGYLAETLRIGSVENPIWAFAFALASWSLK
ncbi:MAG: hypothetical protein GIW95_01185 [Candidatus Eremiobacteraeota bacterium]|nr:hypothetical protein [Candidatus Eremiobacteraeota bacterium]